MEAFDVFDAPQGGGTGEDPFALFDAPTDPRCKRLRQAPSILPPVRRFVASHAGPAQSDLAAGDAESAVLGEDLSSAVHELRREPPDFAACRASARRAADRAWGTLVREKAWPHPSWREAFVIAHLMIACACLDLEDDGEGALRSLDNAFILGGPTAVYAECVELLDEPRAAEPAHPTPPTITTTTATTLQTPVLAAGAVAIERRPCPRTAADFVEVHRARVPLVLERVTEGWPAMRKWTFTWLRETYGSRLVPVELGSLAGVQRAEWSEGLMTFGEFIDTHIIPSCSNGTGTGTATTTATTTATATATSSGLEAIGSHGVGPRSEATDDARATSGQAGAETREPLGYLAQHALFAQLPRLQHDFSIPEACKVSGGCAQHINAWLGPAGTVTSLHFDSYDNILTQVIGYKRVKLYRASDTPKLYPHAAGGTGTAAQGNVSAVDVEAPDLEQFPEFAKAECFETVLGPGDGLYIPAGVWHHVRSLSASVSISFWF